MERMKSADHKSYQRWKDLAEYTPFARMIVEYMWNHRPPLLPAQFAELIAVPKQAVSKWLQIGSEPHPRHVFRIAQATSLSLSQLCLAAGYTSSDYPVLSQTDAWNYVMQQVETVPELEGHLRDCALQALQQIHSSAL